MSEPPRGRVWLICNTPNHVRVLDGARAELARRGVRVRETVTGKAAAPARGMIEAAGRRAPPLGRVFDRIRPGDVAVVCNDWSPAGLPPRIAELKARGVPVLAVVEGCRFTLEGRYRRADRVLGWGPSAGWEGRSAVVVGSPVLEAAMRRRWRGGGGFALINYKFVWGETDPEGAWLAAARAACASAGLRAVVSAHPHMDPGLLRGVETAGAPALDLMERAEILVTRSSTLAHEALAMGAPVALHPAPREGLAEFERPMGAFALARGPAELAEAVAARRRRGRLLPGPAAESRAFLARHLDRRRFDPASRRIAREILRALAEAEAETPAGAARRRRRAAQGKRSAAPPAAPCRAAEIARRARAGHAAPCREFRVRG